MYSICLQYVQHISLNSIGRLRRPHFETAVPIKAKFHMEPQWDGRMKVCSNDPGHVTKMVAIPIYGKNPLKIICKTLRTWYTASVTRALQNLFK